jgi:hypothetical protein
MLPKNNTLTCFIERISELEKGVGYWSSQGMDHGSVFAKISLYAEAESNEITNPSKPFLSEVHRFASEIYMEEAWSTDLTFTDDVLAYFKAKSATIELCSGTATLGTCRVALLPLLINS